MMIKAKPGLVEIDYLHTGTCGTTCMLDVKKETSVGRRNSVHARCEAEKRSRMVPYSHGNSLLTYYTNHNNNLLSYLLSIPRKQVFLLGVWKPKPSLIIY